MKVALTVLFITTVLTIASVRPGPITGRLVDDKKQPITDAVVRPCQQSKKPDGSITTFFVMDTTRAWATAKTDSNGRFVFERDLAPGKYCLAVELGRDLTIVKDVTGQTLEFEVGSKPGKIDWGEIILRRS